MGTWAYSMLSVANANLILAHGSKGQIDAFARPLADGRFHGTMCLSEAHAGSSLSDITTRACPTADGTYRIHGTKMWISAGDHELGENIVHLVLARVPGSPPGVKGISLFIVPKYLAGPRGERGERNDVVVAGLNHKMGARGTVNTILAFGDGTYRPRGEVGAIGFLVGERDHGLAYMFHMMNEARIGVGSQAAALGYTGYLKSLDYARSRAQGRLPHGKDPTSPPIAIIGHPDVRRMLMLQKCYAEGSLALILYCSKLLDLSEASDDDVARRSARMLDVLTPVAKHWPSQWCLAANDLAIQVLGGAGYTRDHDVEQHYRDNRLNAIHEGTTGVQALDLLGRKVSQHSGAGFRAVCEEIEITVERARDDSREAAALADELQTALRQLQDVTLAVTSSSDPDRLSDATAYLEATGHIVIAWLWLEQYLAARDETPLHTGKRAAARYFFAVELPTVRTRLDRVALADRMLLAMDDRAF